MRFCLSKFIIRRTFKMSTKLSQKEITKRLVISAMFIAVSVVLNELTPIKLAFGGSVTLFSMVPLCLIGWVYGISWGATAGAFAGVLNLLVGGLSNFAYVSGIVAYLILIFADYFVAFGVIGLAGMFKNKIQNKSLAIGLGAALACVLRFICHFISGVTIWGDYSGGHISAWIYSFTYNGSYMLPELIITVIGCIAIVNIKPIMKQIEK